MPTHEALATLMVMAAVSGWLNYRYLKLPMTIGVMVLSLVGSVILTVAGSFYIGPVNSARVAVETLVRSIDLHTVVMEGMLSFLLFAGALHVDVRLLANYRLQVLGLAVVGTLVSTFVVGYASSYVLNALGMDLPFIYCLAFGALISPTDPIAVLGVLKAAKVPRVVETAIAGESLFNDGVAVVVMTLLLTVISEGRNPSGHDILSLFAHEALGGIAYGAVLGLICFNMLKTIDDYQVEVLITVATVMGGYSLAHTLHVSGPLAMVVCGLVIGEFGRSEAMSDSTRQHLDTFWELLDTVLNAVLFLLIGLEAIVLNFSLPILVAGGVAIVITLAARFLTVGAPVALLSGWFRLPAGSAKVLTWCGVRGGVSVALALSLPPGPHAETVVLLTYVVVIFSILVQGLTVARVARGALGPAATADAGSAGHH